MKRPVFNKTFYHFFVGFLIIVGVAFGVMLYAGSRAAPHPVDTIATPQ